MWLSKFNPPGMNWRCAMRKMRRKVAALALAGAFALSGMTAGAAFGDNPHAGNSGHFKGSATPCPQNQPQCPPQGGPNG